MQDPVEISLDAGTLHQAEDFAKSHNTTILVIMFTDLVGSTEMGSAKGNIYAQKIRKKHNELIAPIIEHEGHGKIIKSTGDGFLAIYVDPTFAVKRALEIQRVLYEHNTNSSNTIEIRIGIDMGQVLVEGAGADLDIFGNHVNRAARIESLAPGGHIYISNRVYDDAAAWIGTSEDQQYRWQFHGEFPLKGVRAPTSIYEVYDSQVLNEPQFPSVHGIDIASRPAFEL